MSAPASPIGRLPTELLSEIFQLCSLSVEQTEADVAGANSCMTVNPFGLDFTLQLSTVCRKWRNIIYNQANLWSNICITQSQLTSLDHTGTSRLDVAQIATCLKLSRGYPLNILIDARDPEWNWTEDGVGIYASDSIDEDEFAMETDPEEELMPVLFTPDHISTAISLLLPHLARWKSLVILTDTWAPMHRALTLINPAITSFGAPMLDTLALMRCNELPSYYPEFQPAELKDPAFLSGASPSANILPRLRHLTLEGVHADWDALSASLSAASGRLDNLELRYHSPEVRPSLAQYRALLAAAPALTKLAVKCSGAQLPTDGALPSSYVPVPLPALRSLTYGYEAASDGETALALFAAPALAHLALEDASHYASGAQDADGVLAHLAGAEPARAAPFPRLASVALARVDASAGALHAFFRAHAHVRDVALARMAPDALRALLPSTSARTGAASCPCPLLRAVRVRDVPRAARGEWGYYAAALVRERPKHGCADAGVELACAEVDEAVESVDGDARSDAGSTMVESEEEEEEAVEVPESAVASALMLMQQNNVKDDRDIIAFRPEIFDESTFGDYYSSTLVCH